MNPMSRFTEDGLLAVKVSDRLAKELGGTEFGDYHLFLAMAHEKILIANSVLDKHDVLEEKLLPPYRLWFPKTEETLKLELSHDYKKSLELAVDEAKRMGHSKINSAHLLCALMRVKSATMNRICEHFQLDTKQILEDARKTAHESITGQEDISFLEGLREVFRTTFGLGKKKNDE
jgi:ATP-dependent Clp protease ATP-binding subunit ClpA